MGRLSQNLYRKLFARSMFRRMNMKLFHLSLRGLGVLNYENNKISGEEHFIRNVLPTITKHNRPMLLDIGANIGDYSLNLLKRFPEAEIHAFEPHPKNFFHLSQRCEKTNLRLHHCAMGDKPGKCILYDRGDFDGSAHASLYEEVITEIHKQKTVGVEVMIETVDGFVEKEGIHAIDLIKIDTEGNEFAVLVGAANLIQKRQIGCIHFEFNEMNIISRVFFKDFRKILNAYELFRLLPGGLLKLNDDPIATELFGYQNIIALMR